MKKYIILFVLFLFSTVIALADVRLPKLFGDHMVLQRNKPIKVWGWASPGEEVSVSLNGQHINTVANSDGEWELELKKEKAGGPYELQVKGMNEVMFEDVLIGEVWVCSGQSNMEWALQKTDNAETAIRDANNDQIRHIKIQRDVSDTPQDDLMTAAEWKVSTSENAPSFTAVGYYYAKKLNEELGVPIGLINSSWGGTVAETWISREAFEGSDTFRDRIAEVPKSLPDTLLKQKKPNSAPSLLSNAMIEPLIPYTIQGVIWYQGENNAHSQISYEYRKTFPLLIEDWRDRWGQGDFPFYFVQLTSYNAFGGTSEKGSSWAELREAQMMTLSVPNTGMAVITDIGNSKDIHPRNKLDVGNRLAAIALNQSYNKKNPYSGPMYKKMKEKDGKIRIYFDHVEGGLQSKDGEPLAGFEIAGEDQVFKKAEAKIVGNYVEVSSPEVVDPKAVRYGWYDDNIDINLFNTAGLPASPFRTDRWKGLTEGNTKKLY